MDNVALFNLATSPLYVCLGIMFLAYLWALKINFFSLVDVVWSYLFTIVAWIYASLPGGLQLRNTILLAMVCFWSVRLGTHLFTRLKAHFPHEDSRYLELKSKWAKNLKLNFLLFFLFQGLSVVILATPFLVIAINPRPELHPIEILAILVWFIAVGGEALADGQLKKFKANPENKGRVCQAGLWNYSRHPNYFFEWLVWVSYFLFAVTAPNGWVALMSPLVMLYLLMKMTGIPYTEKQSLKSKGDLYREYQKTTSVFVPWFKKKS